MTSRASSWRIWLAAALVCAGNGVLLWFFHDRYWYPTDDGFYAHIAERLLAGEVLNRDIQDIHPGYIHVVHASAFRVFGLDLVSLRYPMIAAAFLQAVTVFLLLRPIGVVAAVTASLATNALGIVHFMSPNANWYCAALAVALALWLTKAPGGPVRLVGAGVLLGTLALFRHLTGVWVAMAVISLVLIERSGDARGSQLTLMRLQIGIMLAAVVGYLVWSPETNPGGLLLMGIWPVLVFAWMLTHVRTPNRDVAVAVGQLLAGAVLAAVPLITYHLVHGSMGTLLHDLVVAAIGLNTLDFFGQWWFAVLPLAGLYQAVSSFDPVRIVNGLYWFALCAVSAANGALLLNALRSRVSSRLLALPLIGVFHAMVALFFEGPLYLHYTAGVSVVCLLWLLGHHGSMSRWASITFATALSVVAIAFHAGQTRERTSVQILRGDRVTTLSDLVDCNLPRCSLKISAADAATYGRFVDIIEAHSTVDDTILALPNDAELYFLTGRRNPTRFYNASQGTTTAEQRRDVLYQLTTISPSLVVFRPDDKYNTQATAEIMSRIRTRYTLLTVHDGAEIYRR